MATAMRLVRAHFPYADYKRHQGWHLPHKRTDQVCLPEAEFEKMATADSLMAVLSQASIGCYQPDTQDQRLQQCQIDIRHRFG